MVRDFKESFMWKKFFMTIFDFIEQFSFQNDVSNFQEAFSELKMRVFLKNGLGSFQAFLILKIWDKPEKLKWFQKQF
jgi:hypothetical protein